MAESYTASDIEVLSGLDPVRRRPGMYTDTTRPNHLAHEVIDNSVDEAIAGYCKNIGLPPYQDISPQGCAAAAGNTPSVFATAGHIPSSRWWAPSPSATRAPRCASGRIRSSSIPT